MNFQIVQ